MTKSRATGSIIWSLKSCSNSLSTSGDKIQCFWLRIEESHISTASLCVTARNWTICRRSPTEHIAVKKILLPLLDTRVLLRLLSCFFGPVLDLVFRLLHSLLESLRARILCCPPTSASRLGAACSQSESLICPTRQIQCSWTLRSDDIFHSRFQDPAKLDSQRNCLVCSDFLWVSIYQMKHC